MKYKRIGFTKRIIALVFVLFVAGACYAFAEDAFEKEINDIQRAMITEGNYETRVSRLNEMLKEHPGDAGVYTGLGMGYYGMMNYEKAYECFGMAREKAKSGAYKDIASYVLSGMDRSRALLETIEQGGEGMSEAHLAMVNSLMSERYYYPAIVMSHIKWLERNEPDLKGLSAFTADVYYSAMLYKEASEAYKKAIEEEPGNVRLYRTLADCLAAMGDFEGAGEYYDKTAELYKKNGTERNAARIKDVENIKKALPKEYGDVTELVRKGRLLEAEDICRRRISLNPSDYAAITQLGDICWEKGRKRTAIKLFRRAERIAPDYAVVHFMLGRAYFLENKAGKAAGEFGIFKEKMKLMPDMDEETADFYVSRLHYMCYAYSTLKRYKEAIRECGEIIKLRPDDQKAHYNLAVCYYVSRKSRWRAYKELKKVIDIDKDTRIAARAEYYIDYLRRNPDPRLVSDFSFIREE